VTREDHLLTFLAGVGLGVAGALLFAPVTGAQARARIKKGADRAGDYLKERSDAIAESAEAAAARGRQAWNETVTKGKDSLDGLKVKAKDKIDDAADAVRKGANQAADRSRDFAHEAGKAMEKGGTRLQDV
jgi:gas vesicle protein